MKKKKQAAKRKPASTRKAVLKDILVNDKVRVVEVTFRPGAESDGMDLPVRVTRALRGGTLTRTFPGGKKEKVKFKTGEVKFGEAVPSHVVRNLGRGTIVLYSVFLK